MGARQVWSAIAIVAFLALWVASQNGSDKGQTKAPNAGAPDSMASDQPVALKPSESAFDLDLENAKEVANVSGLPATEQARVEAAEYRMTGQLKAVEYWQDAYTTIEVHTGEAVACHLRDDRWRAMVLGAAKYQIDGQQEYIVSKAALNDDERLAATAHHKWASNVMSKFNEGIACGDLRSMPYLRIYDMVALGQGAIPLPDRAP